MRIKTMERRASRGMAIRLEDLSTNKVLPLLEESGEVVVLIETVDGSASERACQCLEAMAKHLRSTRGKGEFRGFTLASHEKVIDLTEEGDA